MTYEERFGRSFAFGGEQGLRMQTIWPAALVHTFTGMGAVCALFALRALIGGQWEVMFVWLGVAVVIDGVDGLFARAADVGSRLPRVSGERLDLVVDYLTYVFVPAFALLQAGYLNGSLGLLLASLILLSSLFHFSDLQSKTSDYCFVGFPAIWNVVAFYVFVFNMPGWLAGGLVLMCVVMTFIPLKWAHPMRTPFLWPVTIVATVLWCVAAFATLWSGFPAPPLAKTIFAMAAVYGIALVSLRSAAHG
jgi:phosphatidylcholine synthase